MRQCLDVVDQRGAAEVADLAGEGGLQARHSAPALHRLEHRGLLAADVGAGADDQLEGPAVEETGGTEFPQRLFQAVAGGRVLLPQIDEPLGRLREVHGDERALEHEVRAQLHHVAVLDRPRLAFVRVDHDVARSRLLRDRLPLEPRREAGAPVAGEAGGLELLDDLLPGRQVAKDGKPAARLVVGEGLVGLLEAERGAGVRPPRHLGLDDVAAREHRRDVAVAEALDAEDGDAVRLLLLAREEVLGAEAVADRADADAHGVHRNLEERVERHDLVHLAAADVHVVGERVRELRGDRADLAADAPEVVQEARPLLRQLGKNLGEPEDVYGLRS